MATYKAVMRPALEYVSSIWSPLASSTSINKFMVFHHNQKQLQYPNIKINNIEINCVSQLNFFGIILSADLKYIDHISMKISKVIGIMY